MRNGSSHHPPEPKIAGLALGYVCRGCGSLALGPLSVAEYLWPGSEDQGWPSPGLPGDSAGCRRMGRRCLCMGNPCRLSHSRRCPGLSCKGPVDDPPKSMTSHGEDPHSRWCLRPIPQSSASAAFLIRKVSIVATMTSPEHHRPLRPSVQSAQSMQCNPRLSSATSRLRANPPCNRFLNLSISHNRKVSTTHGSFWPTALHLHLRLFDGACHILDAGFKLH